MPVHEGPWPDGTPCWIDVSVPDPDAARLFYEGLFGWEVQGGAPEYGGYLNCAKNGRLAAGISQADSRTARFGREKGNE